MRTGLIGKKIGCSSFFYDTNEMELVTLVKIDECIVSNVKTKEKNGYNAVQIASIENNLKLEKVNKSQKKLFTKININPKRYLKEFRIDEETNTESLVKKYIYHYEYY